jgi:lipopolysaccharide/colanic/teichoic acid biosynthesis glycosyltransferase/glycosyltransferase involved in cell wall biosynthesis
MTGPDRLKRLIDVLGASIALLLSAPLWALIAVAIRLNDRGPVFFAQDRWGQGGRRIHVLKFRTMVVGANAGGTTVQATRHDPRITRVGRVLRPTALDELPQILSIWKGDMSFVGPRALPLNEVQRHGQDRAIPDSEIPRFRERLAVKPGLTGIAQIYAARDVDRRRKFRYDTFYIRRRSAWLDLRLIALSVWISVRGRWESRGGQRLTRRPAGRRSMPEGSPARTKLVQVIARLNVGGPAFHVVLLNAGLRRLGFSPLLVTGRESAREGSLRPYAAVHGVTPTVIPEMAGELSLNARDLRALVKLYRLMRRERPTIVHTHTGKAGVLGRIAACLAGVPIIVHTFHGHVLRGYYGPVKTWLLRRLERALGRRTDRIVTVSETVKRELIDYGVASADRITVVPLGIDLDWFLTSVPHRGNFRAGLGIPEASPLIGIVGRIVPIKDHHLFCDAARLIAARYPAARFVVVGDGASRSDIERYVDTLGLTPRVLFTGWRRDLPEIYADLDVLVIASRNEGTPVAAIEAMASRCPVVATRVGGVPDLIEDGVTGLLVRSGDATALSDAVLKLLGDRGLVERLTERARARVRGDYTAARLVADIAALYDRLLDRKGLAITARRRPALSAIRDTVLGLPDDRDTAA